jgi:hypothetical protein
MKWTGIGAWHDNLTIGSIGGIQLVQIVRLSVPGSNQKVKDEGKRMK